ncbi:pentapeptide repeat-containing protein [Nocardiopsis sp. B62]|uniref:pentapeptide repeat-containing protein n=1 Tax=Nocardiopsis sp. B62 TaxID=2824874 RepID=UPI001B3803A6|nr:pentapeptide repeat-containing protein [Nocardiopsis sp. B62]MBQ1079895.1 pentapeptide repeat-containing protein [Nocardiopsis sp. B62]
MTERTIPTVISDLPYAEDLRPFDRKQLHADLHEVVHVDGERFEGVNLPGARFIESAFTDTQWDGGVLRRCRFTDVWMRTVRMMGTDTAECTWLDSHILSSMFAGTASFNSEIQRVVFSSCKLNGVNFRASRMADVIFQDCVLTDVDFGEATLTRLTFPGSTLRGLHLAKAKLREVDLRGASELDLASGFESLAGAVIGQAQLIALAPALAANTGITVQDQ